MNWEVALESPAVPPTDNPPAAPPAPPPATCPTLWPTSLLTDRLGRTWWTAEGNLYEASGDTCNVVLSASDAQPFVDRRKLARVLVGRKGNVFLQTAPSGGFIFLKPQF